MDHCVPTVYVVDDEESVRDSLKWLFNSISLRVETFDSAQSFLNANISSSYGCLILDVRMPDMGGLQLQSMLCDRKFMLPIIFLSAYADAQMGAQAIKSGASDFLQKPYRNQALIDAVNAALRLSRELLDKKSENVKYLLLLNSLSHREREVLSLVVAGKVNKVIARMLGISHKTVEAHRARVISKLGVKSISELMSFAMLNNTRCRDCKWLLLPTHGGDETDASTLGDTARLSEPVSEDSY